MPRYNRLSDKKKAIARHRAEAILAMEQLVWRCKTPKQDAVMAICGQYHCTPSTFYRWEAMVRPYHRGDWMTVLVPLHMGRVQSSEFSPEAFDFIKTDYLRLARPTLEACYRRLIDTARERGWTVPSLRTVARRIEELPTELIELRRNGRQALDRMIPAQQRDHSVFHALQAVNADGHKWDVFVRWPDGKVDRPMMCCFQDIYSGMILSWRIDRTATKEAVRLAFGDMVESYGIPAICYFDNGRDFASKQITGGIANR